MPKSFKSVSEIKRAELKAKIKPTDVLIEELMTRKILMQKDVDQIMVSS